MRQANNFSVLGVVYQPYSIAVLQHETPHQKLKFQEIKSVWDAATQTFLPVVHVQLLEVHVSSGHLQYAQFDRHTCWESCRAIVHGIRAGVYAFNGSPINDLPSVTRRITDT